MLYIHIGTPKTGSSAIQAFLKLNESILEEKQMFYPDSPEFSQAYQTSSGNANVLSHLIKTEPEKAKEFIDSLPTESNIILSSENLFSNFKSSPRHFFELFKRHEFKIICYVRRQDNLISSSYNQQVKNHWNVGLPSIEDLGKGLEFCEPLLECLNYIDVNNMIIRPYEKGQFHGGNIFSDFLHSIGLEWDDAFVFPEKVVNPSFDRSTLEFRRRLNALAIDQNNLGLQRLINGFLAKYTVEHDKGVAFQDNNIFTRQERIDILKSYEEKNNEVGFLFLGQDKLFYEDIPNDVEQVSNEFSSKDVVDICEFMLEETGFDANEELFTILAKGTLEKVLGKKETPKDDRSRNLIFKLNPSLSSVSELSNDIALIENRHNVFCIESKGDDPFFTVEKFKGIPNDGKISVRVEIFSPSNTILELFYTSDNDTFDQVHSVCKVIEKGYNEITLSVSEQLPIKSLRLDPGKLEGFYLLYNFEVYDD